ncbi:MAG TPA: TonB-dependent receptor, partial [Pyrinomonadaceae bacterium]
NNATGIEIPFRNRNEFGFRVQGPMPFFRFGDGDGGTFRSGKDKMFFFFLYQKTIDRQPFARVATTLTQSARNGIFTYTAAANDPANGITAGQVVSVNLLSPSFGTGITAIDPTVQARILSLLPAGNTTEGVGVDSRNTLGYRFDQRNDAEQTNWTGRIDYTINDRNSIRGIYRYVFQDLLSTAADTTFNITPNVSQPSNNPFLSLGWTSNFSPNFSNELVGGFSFSNPTFMRTDGTLTNLIVPPTLITSPENTFTDQGRTVKTYNFQDNATYVTGNHSIRFGGQLQINRIRPFDNFGASGAFVTVPTYNLGTSTNTPSISTAQFTNTTLFPGGVPTAQRAAANQLLALLGGIVTSAGQAFNVTSQTSGFVPGARNERYYLNEQYAAYVSDQWRITPELTLTLGLRYDYYTPVRTDLGLFYEPAIADGQTIQEALLNPSGSLQFVGGNAGVANTFHRGDKNNFGPNVSIAWSPRFSGGIGGFLLGEGKTVFRGGYRLGYINDELFKAVINAGVGSPGLNADAFAINPVTGTSALNARLSNLPPIPLPVFVSEPTYAQNNLASGNFFATVYGINPDIKSPKVHEFSVGFQREIGWNSVFEARYVGTRGRGLLRAFDLNQVDIRANGFAADFNRARSNLLLCQAAAGCTTGGNFNAAITGSQPLTVFPNLTAGGLLTNATVTNNLIAGTAADLAVIYFTNGLAGTVPFLANPNAGPADLLDNGAESNYNSLQLELRRRFVNGFLVQANYTFSKVLTDSQGTVSNVPNNAQNRFDPFLDILNPSLEYSRAITDQTHVFNLNFVYELPFGRGRAFFDQGGLTNLLLGGFQLSGTVQVGSGAPISFNDPRGTLNRVGRSPRQTARTNLTKDQLKALVGIYETPNGVFFLPPEVLGRNPDGSINTTIGGTGRGANGFGTPVFDGQVFFNNPPGETSLLERQIVNGPSYQIVNLSLAKRFVFSERYSFQAEINAFNAFNKTNYVIAQNQDINSTNFGRISGTFAPRVIQLAARFNF